MIKISFNNLFYKVVPLVTNRSISFEQLKSKNNKGVKKTQYKQKNGTTLDKYTILPLIVFTGWLVMGQD